MAKRRDFRRDKSRNIVLVYSDGSAPTVTSYVCSAVTSYVCCTVTSYVCCTVTSYVCRCMKPTGA
ncbi:hypothetical protein NQZ68_009884 [Dissostichus eleginoides]|nr:hypothetical protein NQZ68_009882 [Dissostichus eleginoides]KAI9525204.1 hypothetical protein NQZ68_009884 [Dissostichus eleginoides]